MMSISTTVKNKTKSNKIDKSFSHCHEYYCRHKKKKKRNQFKGKYILIERYKSFYLLCMHMKKLNLFTFFSDRQFRKFNLNEYINEIYKRIFALNAERNK